MKHKAITYRGTRLGKALREDVTLIVSGSTAVELGECLARKRHELEVDGLCDLQFLGSRDAYDSEIPK